jgi:hypothetical protein
MISIREHSFECAESLRNLSFQLCLPPIALECDYVSLLTKCDSSWTVGKMVKVAVEQLVEALIKEFANDVEEVCCFAQSILNDVENSKSCF